MPVPGKGHGCIALCDVRAGQRLLCEAPLVELGPHRGTLAHAVHALTPRSLRRFFALAQNEERFGSHAKSDKGIFATNAIPYHRCQEAYCAVFPTVCRLNHSCDANAAYKWNNALGKMTVHALRSIGKGAEITVNYGFDGTAMTRDQRRRRLRASFGFDCACEKCALRGAALRESDERLVDIGTTLQMGSLRDMLAADTEAELARLERRYALTQLEAPDGPFYGVEVILLGFVEYCDAMLGRLASLQARASATERGEGDEEVTITFHATGTDGRSGPASAPSPHLRVRLGLLRSKAAAFAAAARRWATVAREVTRIMAGEDSPAFAAWTEALSVCWREATPSTDADEADAPGGPATTEVPTRFSQLWSAAGLSPSPKESTLSNICQPEATGGVTGGADG